MLARTIYRSRVLPVAHRHLHISRIVESNRASRRKAANTQSPLQLAFKMNDEDDGDDGRPRYQSQNEEVPNVEALDKRWNKMDQLDQDDIIFYLDDRMRGDWKELSEAEKKAIWYVNYGPWGPRDSKQDEPGSIYGGYAKFIAVVALGISTWKGFEEWTRNDEE